MRNWKESESTNQFWLKNISPFGGFFILMDFFALKSRLEAYLASLTRSRDFIHFDDVISETLMDVYQREEMPSIYLAFRMTRFNYVKYVRKLYGNSGYRSFTDVYELPEDDTPDRLRSFDTSTQNHDLDIFKDIITRSVKHSKGKPPVTPEKVSRVKSMLTSGYTRREIARELSISTATIAQIYNGTFKLQQPIPIIVKVVDLSSQGYSNLEISEKLQISSGSVAQHLYKARTLYNEIVRLPQAA